jgi:hypothetical protein
VDSGGSYFTLTRNAAIPGEGDVALTSSGFNPVLDYTFPRDLAQESRPRWVGLLAGEPTRHYFSLGFLD